MNGVESVARNREPGLGLQLSLSLLFSSLLVGFMGNLCDAEIWIFRHVTKVLNTHL